MRSEVLASTGAWKRRKSGTRHPELRVAPACLDQKLLEGPSNGVSSGSVRDDGGRCPCSKISAGIIYS